jgi:hypothetical protein
MTLQRISKNMVSHRLFFHIVQTQTSYTDITTRRISHTSIARTTMLCPFALATCRGVWQSSFVTNAFAENSKGKKKHSLKLNYQRHKNKKKTTQQQAHEISKTTAKYDSTPHLHVKEATSRYFQDLFSPHDAREFPHYDLQLNNNNTNNNN